MAYQSESNPTGNTTQQRAPPIGGSGEDHSKKNRYIDPTPLPTPRRIHDHVPEAHEHSKHEVMDVQKTQPPRVHAGGAGSTKAGRMYVSRGATARSQE